MTHFFPNKSQFLTESSSPSALVQMLVSYRLSIVPAESLQSWKGGRGQQNER